MSLRGDLLTFCFKWQLEQVDYSSLYNHIYSRMYKSDLYDISLLEILNALFVTQCVTIRSFIFHQNHSDRVDENGECCAKLLGTKRQKHFLETTFEIKQRDSVSVNSQHISDF